MTRTLFKLAKAIAISMVAWTIFQVCAAQELSPPAQFLLALDDFYLATPDGGKEGSQVWLTHDADKATLWEIFTDDNIRGLFHVLHASSRLSLDYEHFKPMSTLKLTDNAERRWMIVGLDDGTIEIQTPERYQEQHLVIGLLPYEIYPPLVGLVLPRQRTNGPVLKVHRVESSKQQVPFGI